MKFDMSIVSGEAKETWCAKMVPCCLGESNQLYIPGRRFAKGQLTREAKRFSVKPGRVYQLCQYDAEERDYSLCFVRFGKSGQIHYLDYDSTLAGFTRMGYNALCRENAGRLLGELEKLQRDPARTLELSQKLQSDIGVKARAGSGKEKRAARQLFAEPVRTVRIRLSRMAVAEIIDRNMTPRPSVVYTGSDVTTSPLTERLKGEADRAIGELRRELVAKAYRLPCQKAVGKMAKFRVRPARKTGEAARTGTVAEARLHPGRGAQSWRATRQYAAPAVPMMLKTPKVPRMDGMPLGSDARIKAIASTLVELLNEQVAAGNPRQPESIVAELATEASRKMRRRSKRMLKELEGKKSAGATMTTGRDILGNATVVVLSELDSAGD